MKIISHRGYWKDAKEKNTLEAFSRSFDKGFGTETDIRDYKGKLVISHDVPDENCILLSDFFQCLAGRNLTLALNIKADGLRDLLVKEMESFNITNAFVFDMSVPDQKLYYEQSAVRVYTRMSEQERYPAFYQESNGVWLDSFFEHWYDETDIEKILSDGKELCIVSPELHKRNHLDFWGNLKERGISDSDKVVLCTDFPEDAVTFFR
ncbi:hypothetical protein [Dickeya zeae]|uniref:hypothetical protein n=1 Tax=Dickeya zeae TaxID=204042 RepID=UPI000577AC24|nr:hypothetical protein [Dickeya zeae]